MRVRATMAIGTGSTARWQEILHDSTLWSAHRLAIEHTDSSNSNNTENDSNN